MVSSRLLLGFLGTVSCAVQAYPIRSDEEDHSQTNTPSSTGLATRSPDARLKDPFDVDWFIDHLHAFIPTEGDLSQWIDDVIHDSLHYDDDDDNDDKKNEVHVENSDNKNSNNSTKNNNNPPPAAPTPTPAPQSGGKNATNTTPPSNDDTKDDISGDIKVDVFDTHSLLSTLSSIFKGLDAADEVVPS